MVRPGQDGTAAPRGDGICDLGFGAGDDDRTDPGLHGPAPDMDDHRIAMDVGKRLAGARGGGEARGDDDYGVRGQGGHRRHLGYGWACDFSPGGSSVKATAPGDT